MASVRRALTVFLLLFVLIPAVRLPAQDLSTASDEHARAQALRDYIRANYTKSEYLAPMRDGVRLFISVYAPKDSSQRYPIWMMRTPYTVAPYGVDNYPGTLGPSEFFARAGYIFAYCDVRGRGKSEGEFVHVRPYIPNKTSPRQIDEATDAYDTIDFLLEDRPQQQRPRRGLGNLLPRLLRHHGDFERAPGLEGGLAAGAGHRVVPGRRLAAQRRAVSGPRLQFPLRLWPPQDGGE